ncbi:XIAP-associated factor 1, partial [Heterocephalus glaber]
VEGDFQVCGNCRSSVPSAHFIIHEAHCLRFLVFCSKCEEPVPGVKMEEHCEQRHTQVTCVMCQQSVQKSLLELHETKECQERPVKCKFCELTVYFSKLETHESHCGSRTERCPHCDQLLLLWQLAQHKDVCQREQALLREGKGSAVPERKIYCNYCNEMITGSKHNHYMDDCSAASALLKNLLRSFPSRTGGNQTPTAEKDVRPKTKNTNRFPLPSENSTKQAPREKSRTMDLPSVSELKSRTASPTGNKTAYDILRKCSQCGILLPLPTLMQHQVKCRWLASSKGEQVRKSS